MASYAVLHSTVLMRATVVAQHKEGSRAALKITFDRQSAPRLFAVIAKTAFSEASLLPPRAQAIIDYWFGVEDGWGTETVTTSEEAARAAYYSNCPTQMKKWFFGGDAVDSEIRTHFLGDLQGFEANPAPVMSSWLQHPRSALALVILLDQLTRNVYRNDRRAFSLDNYARDAAKALVDHPRYADLRPVERLFALLPFEHHEDMTSQTFGIKQFSALCDELSAVSGVEPPVKSFATNALKLAEEHHSVIQRFGRYPHRNAVLGREATADETEFLEEARKKSAWMK